MLGRCTKGLLCFSLSLLCLIQRTQEKVEAAHVVITALQEVSIHTPVQQGPITTSRINKIAYHAPPAITVQRTPVIIVDFSAQLGSTALKVIKTVSIYINLLEADNKIISKKNIH